MRELNLITHKAMCSASIYSTIHNSNTVNIMENDEIKIQEKQYQGSKEIVELGTEWLIKTSRKGQHQDGPPKMGRKYIFKF